MTFITLNSNICSVGCNAVNFKASLFYFMTSNVSFPLYMKGSLSRILSRYVYCPRRTYGMFAMLNFLCLGFTPSVVAVESEQLLH